VSLPDATGLDPNWTRFLKKDDGECPMTMPEALTRRLYHRGLLLEYLTLG
jgi:hypothetical protein